MKQRISVPILAVMGIVTATASSLAVLVGVNLVTYPRITYQSTIVTSLTYTTSNQLFAVDATPTAVLFSGTEALRLISGARSLAIRVHVDSTGALIGGVAGNDFSMSGTVTRVVGTVTNTYSGLLLTGEVTAFGFLESGATDQYDFRFTPTGGALLSFFSCGDIGVQVTSELSTFTGSFTTNFTGRAKGNIGLEDLIPPTVTCPYGDANFTTNLQCNSSSGGQHGAFVTYPDPIGTDNCNTNLTFIYSPPSGSFFALDASDISTNYLVTLTAIDASSNQASCTFTVTVEDTLAPVLDVSNPIIGACGEEPFILTNDLDQCSATFTFSKPTAVDECCTNGVTVTVSAVDQNGAVIILVDNGDGTLTGHFPVTCGGSNIITSVASDGRGNTSQHQCPVLVVDAQIPVITCVDQVIECTGGPVTFQNPTSYDNCPNLMISTIPTNGSVLNLGTNQIVSIAADCSGHTNQCTFNVIVRDTTPPTINCPAFVTVECGQPTDPGSLGTPTISDFCDANPTMTFTDITSGVCPVTISREWIAADHSGNTNSCTQIITITNSIPPSITVPSGGDLGCSPATLPTDDSVQALVTVSNTCGSATINVSHIDATNGCAVTRTFTVTAANACNNSSAPQTVVYTWTVETTPPSVIVPPSVGGSLGCNPATLPTDDSLQALVSANGGCGAAAVYVSHVDGGTACAMTRTFTIRATDNCNSPSAPQTVVYTWSANTTPPSVIVPPSVGGSLGCNPATLPTDDSVKALVSANGGCGAATITVTHVDSGTTCAPSRTFTVTASDACNNSSAPQTVVYSWTTDTTPPSVTVPAGGSLGCNPATLPTDASVKALVSASDTCGGVSVTVTHVDSGTACAPIRTFTVTAADACNNVSAPQSVVYTWTADTNPPNVTVPPSVNLGCNPATLPTDASINALVTALDDCTASPTINVSHIDATNGCTTTRTFTVTATDGCNNSSAPQTVVYSWTTDTTPPTITSVPAGANLGCNATNLPTDVSVKALVTAIDNCGTPTVSVTHVDGVTACVPSRTFTIVATDACGNTSATQTVAYSWSSDQSPPTLSGCTNQVVYQQQSVTNAQCHITDVFNCKPIKAGCWIWFNSTLNPCAGVTNKTYTVCITGQTITGTIGGSNVSLAVPDAQITYSSTTTNATTTFTGGKWVTTCPLPSTLVGDQHGSALAYQLPYDSSGFGNLTWNANFGVTPGVSVNWQWAASVYTNFSGTYTALGVKPVDDNKACGYKNNDAACTPENYKQYCVFGARSGTYGNYCGNRTFPWVCNRGTTTVCSGGVVQYTPPTATDNCGGIPSVVCVPPPGVGFIAGSTNVICTATDDCGNTNFCSFTVSLQAPPPTITCPGNITTNTTTTACSQVVKWTATGSSACGGSVTTTCTPASGSTFATGTTPVTCMAIEVGHGTNSCSFTVTVNDTTKPTITCPANITTNTCNATAVVTFAPTVSDNCAGVTYNCTPASGSAFAQGTNTVTCTATDTSANTASCSFKVIVTSTAPATPSCPTVTPGTGKCTLTWTACSGSGPITYNVLRSTSSGGSYTTIASGVTTLTYTNTGCTKGTKYYYCISSTNCKGTSANSAQAYATSQ